MIFYVLSDYGKKNHLYAVEIKSMPHVADGLFGGRMSG